MKAGGLILIVLGMICGCEPTQRTQEVPLAPTTHRPPRQPAPIPNVSRPTLGPRTLSPSKTSENIELTKLDPVSLAPATPGLFPSEMGTSAEAANTIVPDPSSTTSEMVSKDLSRQIMGQAAGNLRLFSDFDIKFHWCPAGQFQMGSPEGESGRNEDETQVEVTLTDGYWIAETEVTQLQWKSVMEAEPWNERAGLKADDSLPAIGITWQDAADFCAKLTEYLQASGKVPADAIVRLPTEAEWEYACRAGTTNCFSFGSQEEISLAEKHAQYKAEEDRHTRRIPEPVAAKSSNPWGLFDMHGNVAEWCLNVYEKTYVGGENPVSTAEGQNRVLRGGDFANESDGIRSAYREEKSERARGSQIGFRPVIVFKNSDSLQMTDNVEENPIPEIPAGFAGNEAGEKRNLTGLQIECIWCPPSSMKLGSPEVESGRSQDEQIVEVNLAPGYWMNSTEVTQKLWKGIMKTEPWINHNLTTLDNAPAVYITWNDAHSFCERFTELERKAQRLPEGVVYRLPTEAEWEVACRAGTRSRFSYGDDLEFKSIDQYAATKSGAFPAPMTNIIPVKQRTPNSWGFYDMHGNVSEWCANWYKPVHNAGTNPQGPKTGTEKVIRGGDWMVPAEQLRSAARGHLPPDENSHPTGFRFVVAFEPTEGEK